MKVHTIVILLALLTLGLALSASAQDEFLDVHVFAQFYEFDYVTAVEFSVSNVPPENCSIEEFWSTNLIIGNVVNGLSLAFEPPLAGPLAYLGFIRFTAYEDVGEDYLIRVVPSADMENLYIVGEFYNVHDATGGRFTINCSDIYQCWCDDMDWAHIGLWADMDATVCYGDLPVVTIPAQDSAWSVIKALYR